MKEKTILILTFVYVIAYLVIVVFGSMFSVSFGAEKPFIAKVLAELLSFPFNWHELIMKSYWYLLLNFCFWGVLFAMIIAIFIQTKKVVERKK